MRVISFVEQVIRRLRPNGRGKLHTNPAPSSEDNSLSSRRALLTGGVALAGASTLASATAEAAVTYVALGTLSNTAGNTNVTTTGGKGLVGVSKANSGIGVQGICHFNSGAGVSGISNGGGGTGVSGTGTN